MAGSTAALAAILLVDLVAFSLAIGAEQSRPSESLETDPRDEWTYCVYHPDASSGMGGAALRPGGARGCALMLFLSSCALQTWMMAS